MTSEQCDNCKREPVPFKAVDFDGIERQYYFHIVRNDEDPDEGISLMSNGAFAFRVLDDKEHPVSDEYQYFCLDCFDAMFGVSEEDEEEDEEDEDEPDFTPAGDEETLP